MKGTVFSIEEFSVYDGPGIRTTVFLKGCPLKCRWCHNPEGQNPEPEIVRSPNGCINCGNCTKSSITENQRRYFSEDSIKNCPRNLLRVCGDILDSEELCEEIFKNKDMLQDGGVTFSGGEPLWQSEFLAECLTYLKGKIHTAVQTSGYADENTFLNILDLADYFLYDIKLLDNEKHIKYTGASNEKILKNYLSLAKSGVDFITRIPLIPTVNDTEENIRATAELLVKNSVTHLEILPYNKMAGSKYKMLLRRYTPNFDEQKAVDIHKEIFDEYGIKIKIM